METRAPETAALERLIDRLEQDLQAAREDLQQAREREARLLGLLERQHPQTPRVRKVSQRGEPPPRPYRQEIRTLLKNHPKGLSRRQIEIALDSPRNLADVLQGMIRASILTRVSPAVFTLAPSHNTSED